MEALKRVIQSEIGTVTSLTPCSGGDISRSYKVTTDKGNDFFLKVQTRERASMFETEERGLSLLRENSSFRIPKSFGVYTADQNSGLLLEWIEPGNPDERSWQKFWSALSALHDVRGETFGLDYDNFIGPLDQSNGSEDTWIEFWIEHRISPLMIQCEEKGIIKSNELPSFLLLFDRVRNHYREHDFTPQLLHGDLWKGNLMFDTAGDPVLVDPAVYYGWPEMELAFMELFGGFESTGKENYKPQCQNNFIGDDYYMLWQIYPLLVHTIVFGGTYKRRLMTAVTHALDLL